MITVFTPTYNRAYILDNLYQSLKRQTCKDFEWIIVDDASTDNTAELVKSFDTVGVGIHYCKQEHGGKHRAINRAVKIARGEYFFIVDSDDYLTDDAIAKLVEWTADVDNPKLAGVAGLRMDTQGQIIGGKPVYEEGQYVELANTERAAYNLDSDKAEAYRTSVLRRYPFPEFPDEYFVTEATVWDAIATDGYKLRWYNYPIYICEYLEDGLTQNGANELAGFLANIRGYARYCSVEMIAARSLEDACRVFMNYETVCNMKGLSTSDRARMLGMSVAKYNLWKIKRKLFGKANAGI